MLSKNQIKSINQLKLKKYRRQNRLFFAEGIKTVKELLASDYEVDMIYTTTDVLWGPEGHYQIISEKDLKRISHLKTPQIIFGVFRMPRTKIKSDVKLNLVLDGVRDPGNMGTIIRLCDWFGVEQLVCSNDTVDCYNPKTVQATMGSLARVNIVYTDLKPFLAQSNRPLYGTFMEGDRIYDKKLPGTANIIMGNEANGISETLKKLVDEKLAIPQFGKKHHTESLNVATATAIVLNEFRRNT